MFKDTQSSLLKTGHLQIRFWGSSFYVKFLLYKCIGSVWAGAHFHQSSPHGAVLCVLVPKKVMITHLLITAEQCWHRISVSPGGQNLGRGNNQDSRLKLSKGTLHTISCLLRCKSIHYYNACLPVQLLYVLKACFPGNDWWEVENKAFVFLCFCAQPLLSSLLNCLYL